MTALELLERCRKYPAEKAEINERIWRWRDSLDRLGMQLRPNGGSHGSGSGDRMTAVMAAIDELERALQKRDREYTAETLAVNRLLEGLPGLEAAIMARYYLDGLTLSAIAQAMGYSYGYVRVRKAEACSRLALISPQKIMTMLPAWYIENM